MLDSAEGLLAVVDESEADSDDDRYERAMVATLERLFGKSET